MISELASDLLDRVRSVAALADTTLYTVGGVVEDKKQITLPACRLLFLGDHEYEDASPNTPRLNESAIIPSSQQMLAVFVALIIVQYTDDTDILDTEFPLLEAVKRAVHGKEAPGGHRWRDIGQSKAFVYADRIGYEQRFSVNWVLNA